MACYCKKKYFGVWTFFALNKRFVFAYFCMFSQFTKNKITKCYFAGFVFFPKRKFKSWKYETINHFNFGTIHKNVEQQPKPVIQYSHGYFANEFEVTVKLVKKKNPLLKQILFLKKYKVNYSPPVHVLHCLRQQPQAVFVCP